MDDDVQALTELNRRFIESWQVGSLDELDAILDPEFVYLDGVTGETKDRDGYRAGLTGPNPTLAFDQVHVHVTGDTAVVAGRTTRDGQTFRRYVDTYRRVDGGWSCVHGCLWPIQPLAV